ncbi:metallophosphatase [Rhodococcus ruber Chol-4]|uniref:Calcineurin-like phosphoesterase domain-containing protein n=1 Tax=Rhodococcus ruber TaxID=1830 RepID=A0A098BP67_9NOCA|nr:MULTISPECIES: metallophosphoesterase [Rhodococcus]MDX5311630.1 metallophosphoesterase [Rhodococcus sp. (in: high G+C Gram-positive bacteria)]RIK04339.1 MAG: metallophosphatase [Acidobacteriota bacterium]ATQ30464.1 metallophosphatase [Rhodococcus ruber]AWG97378.1 metallophosphatase [Rhodococcus ruber]AXY50055.1 metallophosphatase [Rhodococcus ruber]
MRAPGWWLPVSLLAVAALLSGPAEVTPPAPVTSVGIPATGLTADVPATSATMYAGVTDSADPPLPRAVGERGAPASVGDEFDEYPYVRYELEFPPGTESVTLRWQGRSVNLDDLALHVRTDGSWGEPRAVARPEVPGGPIVLEARVTDVAGPLEILVIDAPRRDRSFRDAAPDQAFADPADYDFAIQHLTDTQYLARDDTAVFRDMTTWTAQQARARKIAYAVHTGDLIQSWIRPGAPDARARTEFEVASEAMGILEAAGVPYGVLPGNHDNLWNVAGRLVPGEHERNHALYNEYFGPQRYRDRPQWGDSVTDADNSAHYDLFEIAGTPFLVLYLGYNPPEHVMHWAEGVLAAHPDRNTIVAAHYYLDEDGRLRMSGFGDIGGSSGQQIWNRLVVPHESVFMVLSGHVDGQTTVTDRPIPGSDRRVVEMLADYQYFLVDGRRATGFQRLLQFDLDGGTVAVTTHSPALDSFRVEDHDPRRRYTPEDGDFVVDVQLRAGVPRAVIPG